MSTRPLRLALLLIVVFLAVALALTISRGAVASSLFQSSPLLPGEGPLPTDTPDPLLFEPTQAPEFPPSPPTEAPIAAPIIEPPILLTDTPAPVAGGPGFLPAPTLTNPDDLLAGGPLTTAGQPPLSGAAAPVDEPEPAPEPDPPGAAQLIDSIMVAFGYAWLCCGAALLALAAVAFVWLVRRSARRRSSLL